MKLFLYCEYSTWVTDNNAVFSEDCKGSVCVEVLGGRGWFRQCLG